MNCGYASAPNTCSQCAVNYLGNMPVPGPMSMCIFAKLLQVNCIWAVNETFCGACNGYGWAYKPVNGVCQCAPYFVQIKLRGGSKCMYKSSQILLLNLLTLVSVALIMF